MCENGDKFNNPPKSEFSSDFLENSSSTPDLIKCPVKFLPLGKNSKKPDTTCAQCHINYKDFIATVDHSCRPYKCEICNIAFSFDYKLNMHKCTKIKVDKTETNEISTFDSPSSLSAEPPDNDDIFKKTSKLCSMCGKKLSPRCRGIICRSCKNTTVKDKKSTLRYKSSSKCTSSLSELSLSERVENSPEIQVQIETCSQSTNTTKDEITTSSDISGDPKSLHMNLSQKKRQASTSKKNDSSLKKRKYRVSCRKYPNGSNSENPDISLPSSHSKKKSGIRRKNKVRKKTVSEDVDTVYSDPASESSTYTSFSHQIPESGILTTDCQDRLVNSNSRKCRKSKTSTVLSENSLGSNEDSTSEVHIQPVRCNKLDNVPVEGGDITLSTSTCNDHESLPLDEVDSHDISSKGQNSSNLKSGSHHIEPRYSENLTSDDFSSSITSKEKEINLSNKLSENSSFNEHVDRPLDSASDSIGNAIVRPKNNLSTEMNLFSRKRNGSVKKSKNSLKRLKLLSLEEKGVGVNNPRKQIGYASSQEIAGESNNVLIASLKDKEKATKKRFSSNEDNIMKFRHKKFSRKHTFKFNKSVTSLSLSQKNLKHVSFENIRTCVTPSGSSYNESIIETSFKETSGKSRKRIFLSKTMSEEVNENSRTFSANTYNTTGNKKQKMGHSNSSSLKGRGTTDKVKEKNMSELSSSKGTAYSISDDRQHRKADNIAECISLGSLIKALPDYGAVLMRGSVSSCNAFKCPKCNYVFKHIKRACDHVTLCPLPKHKEKELKLLSDAEFVCSVCYQHWPSVDELYRHKKCCPVNIPVTLKQNSSIPISDYIYHYENANKNHVCPKCSYSCLSLHTFNQHQCEKRLELMKTCVVAVEKLTKHDLATFDNLAKFECPSCFEVFYDNAMFQNHSKIHVGEKSSDPSVKENANFEKKKFLHEALQGNSLEEIKKKILEDFSKLETKGYFPNLDLNISMPYDKQKLFIEAAREILSENISVFESEGLGGFKFFTGNEDDSSDMDDTANSQDNAPSSVEFQCKCRKIIDPNVEAKPCLKCLNEYLMKLLESTETGRTVVQNKGAQDYSAVNFGASTSSAAIEVNSRSAAVASSSHSNYERLPSGSTYIPNICNPSNSSNTVSSVLHLNEVPTNEDSSSVSTTSIAHVTSIQTSDLCQTTSNSDISSENSATPKINIEECSTKQLIPDYLKILCYFSDNDASNVNQESLCGSKMPSNVKKTLLNRYRSVTIYKEVALVLEDIRFQSKCDQITLFIDIEPEIFPETASESDKKSKKISFLEMLLDVSHPVILSSPLTLSDDSETLDSVHNQNFKSKDSSPDYLVQAETCERKDIQYKQALPCTKCIFYWEFEELMEFFLCNENDFNVTFDILPFNVKIKVDWIFDEKLEYSIYASKSPRRYYCAACIEELSLSSLLDHLTTVHNDIFITIFIM